VEIIAPEFGISVSVLIASAEFRIPLDRGSGCHAGPLAFHGEPVFPEVPGKDDEEWLVSESSECPVEGTAVDEDFWFNIGTGRPSLAFG
jgi:hypothetical protein